MLKEEKLGFFVQSKLLLNLKPLGVKTTEASPSTKCFGTVWKWKTSVAIFNSIISPFMFSSWQRTAVPLIEAKNGTVVIQQSQNHRMDGVERP